jgi:hypothetical protein
MTVIILSDLFQRQCCEKYLPRHGRVCPVVPSLRAKRSNPELYKKDWIASSLALLAMAIMPDLTEVGQIPYGG